MRDRLIEQVEQVPLGLANAATDCREFDRWRLPAQVAFGLVAADDSPAQRGLNQPPVKRGPVDRRPAGLFITVKEILDTAQPAGGETQWRAEPPGPDTKPGQV